MSNEPDHLDAPSGEPRLEGSHPLELIEFFRRWPKSPLRDLAYSLLFGLFFCLLFFVLDLPRNDLTSWQRLLWVHFVVAECIALVIHSLFTLGDMKLAGLICKRYPALRIPYYVVVPMIGIFLGMYIGFGITHLSEEQEAIFTLRGAMSIAVVAILVSIVLISAFVQRSKQLKANAKMAEQERRVLEAEHRLIESQLKVLQAQIEPHFLYNTLANAVALIQADPPKARALLEALIEYLRSSLDASRASETTLAQEMHRIRAYLELMQIRMQERLQFEISFPADLGGACIPPMLIQPLVENAIRHGLEPKLTGGSVIVKAEQLNDLMVLTVEDQGVGVLQSGGGNSSGVGLDNIRSRLSAMYGISGRMEMFENVPSGVIVRISIPSGIC